MLFNDDNKPYFGPHPAPIQTLANEQFLRSDQTTKTSGSLETRISGVIINPSAHNSAPTAATFQENDQNGQETEDLPLGSALTTGWAQRSSEHPHSYAHNYGLVRNTRNVTDQANKRWNDNYSYSTEQEPSRIQRQHISQNTLHNQEREESNYGSWPSLNLNEGKGEGEGEGKPAVESFNNNTDYSASLTRTERLGTSQEQNNATRKAIKLNLDRQTQTATFGNPFFPQSFSPSTFTVPSLEDLYISEGLYSSEDTLSLSAEPISTSFEDLLVPSTVELSTQPTDQSVTTRSQGLDLLNTFLPPQLVVENSSNLTESTRARFLIRGDPVLFTDTSVPVNSGSSTDFHQSESEPSILAQQSTNNTQPAADHTRYTVQGLPSDSENIIFEDWLNSSYFSWEEQEIMAATPDKLPVRSSTPAVGLSFAGAEIEGSTNPEQNNSENLKVEEVDNIQHPSVNQRGGEQGRSDEQGQDGTQGYGAIQPREAPQPSGSVQTRESAQVRHPPSDSIQTKRINQGNGAYRRGSNSQGPAASYQCSLSPNSWPRNNPKVERWHHQVLDLLRPAESEAPVSASPHPLSAPTYSKSYFAPRTRQPYVSPYAPISQLATYMPREELHPFAQSRTAITRSTPIIRNMEYNPYHAASQANRDDSTSRHSLGLLSYREPLHSRRELSSNPNQIPLGGFEMLGYRQSSLSMAGRIQTRSSVPTNDLVQSPFASKNRNSRGSNKRARQPSSDAIVFPSTDGRIAKNNTDDSEEPRPLTKRSRLAQTISPSCFPAAPPSLPSRPEVEVPRLPAYMTMQQRHLIREIEKVSRHKEDKPIRDGEARLQQSGTLREIVTVRAKTIKDQDVIETTIRIHATRVGLDVEIVQAEDENGLTVIVSGRLGQDLLGVIKGNGATTAEDGGVIWWTEVEGEFA
jgi:hypothetical protein